MATHQHRRSNPVVTVLGVLVTGSIGAVVVAAVLLPRIGGGTPYVILTGSMRPAMPPGTLVVDRHVDAARIVPGSVITYQLVSGRPDVVTHRVVAEGISATGERVFRTRGDANTATDPGWVRPVQVRGERWYDVPYLGYVTTLVGARQRTIFQGLLIAGLLTYAAAMLTLAARERFRPVTP